MSQEQPPPTQPVGPPAPRERRPQQPPEPWTGPQTTFGPAPGQPGQAGQAQPGGWGGGPASYGPYPPPQPTWPQAPDRDHPGWYAGPGTYAGPSGPQARLQESPSSRDQTTLWRTVLQIACPVLLVVGLAVQENGRRGYTDSTLWAIFATVAALVQLAPLVLRGDLRRSWTTGAAGVAGLIGYWVVIVLPGIDSNTGFLQTFAVVAAAVGCWLTPGRRISLST